jgi:DNA recombination protein RmuC
LNPLLLPALTAILGAALALLVARLVFMRRLAESRGEAGNEAAAAQARAADAQRRAEELQEAVADLHVRLADSRAAHAALERDTHWLSEEAERHRQALGSTQALLDAAQRSLRDSFQALAAEALHTNRAAFLDMARSSFETLQKDATTQIETRHKAFDSLVGPIAERLAQVDARLEEAERERLQAYTRLMEQVSALGSTADTLSRALRTPAVRGRWGEMQLRRVIEIAGMLHRCDFDEQRGLFSENGRLRPDVIVHLPGGKQIVIDAKAPLEAFLDAQECREDEGRTLKLQAHARHVREHMDKLGSKAYWEPLAASLEMVVMFLPGETLFSTALQHDLTLIEHGLAQRVLIASPITLIALLTTIAHTWRQEALAENYREVAGLGRELYDRLTRYTDYFEDLRKKLDGAVQAYNQAAGSFESRVLVSARRLRDLDVTTARELPTAQPIDTVPRVLKQAGLMGLPEEATRDPEET